MAHKDIQQWHFTQGQNKLLTIGAEVCLPMDHEFKRDWPGKYFVVGIKIDDNDALVITISDTMSSVDSSDGWYVQDLIAA